jgi:lipopolysaccharide export system protein LptA
MRSPRPPLVLLALALAGGEVRGGEPAPRPAARAGEFRLPLLSQNKQTGLLTGTGARTQPDGTVWLETARVEHQYPAGPTNVQLLILASNCVVDLRANRVSSAAGLHVATGDGQLDLEGTGFQWQQTTGELTVSNQVHTRIRKRPADPAAAGQVLTIRAGEMQLHLASNQVAFRRQVQAADPELEVRAERLAARRGPAGRFDRLEVEGDVEILSRRDGSRTTSERAEYRLTEAGEEIELTGRPRWTDAVREAQADLFRLERGAGGAPQTLRALGRSSLKLPLGTNSPSLWPLPGNAPAAPAGTPESGREFVRLTAEALTLFLPPTNGPVQGVLAETNVVIADLAEAWRATAARARFTNDVLELSGAPHWSGRGREVSGERLRLNLRERSVAVLGGARLRLPAGAFASAASAALPTHRPPARAWTNLFVVIEAEAAHFAAGRLTFAPPVRARVFAGEQPLGELTCRDLTVFYRDQLEAIEALGAVRLEQFARPERPGLTRALECERLRAEFAADGFLRQLEAAGGVTARQRESREAARAALLTEVQAQSVQAWFLPGTNRLDRATAAGQVRVSRGDRRAEGERATYTAATGRLELTGQPRVETPEGRITGAEVLTWDTRHHRAGGRGAFLLEWTALPDRLRTNLLARPPGR